MKILLCADYPNLWHCEQTAQYRVFRRAAACIDPQGGAGALYVGDEDAVEAAYGKEPI